MAISPYVSTAVLSSESETMPAEFSKESGQSLFETRLPFAKKAEPSCCIGYIGKTNVEISPREVLGDAES
jgi:hypothetical protein